MAEERMIGPMTVGRIEKLSDGETNPQTLLLVDIALRLAQIQLDLKEKAENDARKSAREIKPSSRLR
jgi:hypothetical protein